MKKYIYTIIISLLLMSFTMTALAAIPFTDVEKGKWYYSTVEKVYDLGLMTGTKDRQFEPETPMSRAMVVSVLHRMAGKPTVTYQKIFKDVEKGQWYTTPIIWAATNGIISGYTEDNTFRPNNNITREEVAVILRNYVQSLGIHVKSTANISRFKDTNKVSSWSKTAISWTVENGIMSGTTDGYLNPKKDANRAECAKMFLKVYELIELNLVNQLSILSQNYYIREWENNDILCEASLDYILVGEKDLQKYSKLNEVLKNSNRKNQEEAQLFVDEMTLYARREYEQYGVCITDYRMSLKYYVQRADNHIFSARLNKESYSGGAHPMYSVESLNLNPDTGKELLLEDIVKNIDNIPQILTQKLKEKYTDIDFSLLLECLEQYNTKDFIWTLNYQNITFYFNPGTIAPYADGLLTVTLWFDEYSNLFNKKYIHVPQKGYAIMLPFEEEIAFDLKSTDGKRDVIYVTDITYEGDYKYLAARLNKNVYSDEYYYAYRMIPYLVCVREGKNEKYFLYVEGQSDSDSSTLYIYDLNSGEINEINEMYGKSFHTEIVGEIQAYYNEIFNDPSNLVLDNFIYIFGTTTAYKRYLIKDDGIPYQKENYYTIYSNCPKLISKIDLEVTILSTNKKEVIPAGSVYTFLRTDGGTYVDFKLYDGRECRIKIDSSTWPIKVNGVSEYDCFNEIIYAG